MAGEWEEYSLKGVLEQVADNRGKNPQSYSEKGIPVIDNYLITSNWRVDLTKSKRNIDSETYENFIRKHIKEDDVLITLVGNGFGQVAITPKENCVIIQNTVGLRCNSAHNNHYLYYLLKGNREVLTNLNIGAAQPSIKVGNLLELSFEFPPLPEQKAIAHVLGSLDDKIELNRRINETLEGIAQALFKSWFLDFDPVIDNALAAGNPIPEPLAQRAETRRQEIANGTANRETAQIFPASFRFTEELGWIPEGWEVSTMEDFSIEVESGKRPKGGIDKSLNDGVPSIGAESLLSIGNFEYSKLKYVQKEFADKSTKGWVKNYDVGIYKDGANVGDPSRVSLFGNGFPFEDFMVNEHVFLLRSNVIGQPFLYSLFRTEGISQQLRVMGTSKAAQPGLNQKEVLSCKFVAPNNNQFDEFNRIIFPLIDKRLFFGKESQTLAKLRDVLLPKLISGELRIPQVEKMVEEAVA